MGTYTELNCAFSLYKDTPQHIVDTLRYMTRQAERAPITLPPHPLFANTRWDGMLRSCSSYFVGDPHSTVRQDEIDGQYRVTIRCNFKNYDDEIEKFFDWITPHIHALPGDFIGYIQSDITDVPTLLYYPRRSFTPEVPEEILGEMA